MSEPDYGTCYECPKPATTYFGDVPLCAGHMDIRAEIFQKFLDESKARATPEEDDLP